jgi:hypothetical protein
VSAVRRLYPFTKGHQEQRRGVFSLKDGVAPQHNPATVTNNVFSAATKSMFPHKALSIAGYSQVHWTPAVFDISACESRQPFSPRGTDPAMEALDADFMTERQYASSLSSIYSSYWPLYSDAYQQLTTLPSTQLHPHSHTRTWLISELSICPESWSLKLPSGASALTLKAGPPEILLPQIHILLLSRQATLNSAPVTCQASTLPLLLTTSTIESLAAPALAPVPETPQGPVSPAAAGRTRHLPEAAQEARGGLDQHPSQPANLHKTPLPPSTRRRRWYLSRRWRSTTRTAQRATPL